MQTHPSQMFSDFGWPLDDSMSQQSFDNNNNFYNIIEGETSGGSFLGLSPSPQPNNNNGWNIDDSNSDGKGVMVDKKLNHNASERDRRKKINSLYASLRSLIPESGHKKKLSIPATVSQVLKYIPEIQNEVERLIEKKEALSRKMCRRLENNTIIEAKNKQKSEVHKSFFIGTANQLGDREILIQISLLKSIKGSFSEVLLHLEQEQGLKLLNLSTFESSEGRIFHNLHLQLEKGAQVVDLQSLREKLSSFYENRLF
ncbi:basic helix-loop-helix transcription factor [Lithospermum erythrorhizon]|uniref:Basic helix-loop-helix transcription factor n=1 Tax=Lithospermum erythrorhizon TaxID=34254 RepID=A0AAV3R8W3_LITER